MSFTYALCFLEMVEKEWAQPIIIDFRYYFVRNIKKTHGLKMNEGCRVICLKN